MHALFASVEHLPVATGIALLAALYGVKLAAGWMLLARFRRWRAGRIRR